jgi:hypothetical protein
MSENVKEWTLMFVFASDNPLAPSIVTQLKTIKQAGFHQQVNVVAQFDPQPEGTPTHIFDVNLINKLRNPEVAQIGFSGRCPEDPFVSNLIEDKLWSDQTDRRGDSVRRLLQDTFGSSYNPPIPPPGRVEVAPGEAASHSGGVTHDNSGSETRELNPRESLKAFLRFCRREYPARRFILFILGHGVVVGNDIFLLDENADEQSLRLKDLGVLLNEFNNYRAEWEKDYRAELELISFHSCSVSSVEVAYELQGTANHMLASQGPAFVGSWPYRQILMRIFSNVKSQQQLREEGADDEATRRCIREMVDDISAYCFHNSKDFLLAGYSFDVALVDLNTVPSLTTSISSLVRVLRESLDDPATRNLIVLAHWESQSHWQESYTDIHDFCFCLARQCRDFLRRLGANVDEISDQTSEGEVSDKKDEQPSNLGGVLGEMEGALRRLIAVCNEAMRMLDDGVGRRGERVVVKSQFAGPSHQYSHGLSIYFPWSRPVSDMPILEEYGEYKFNLATGWLDFLNEYFDKTQRQTQSTEVNVLRGARGLAVARPDVRTELNEDLAALVFNGEGRLSNENALTAPAEKANPRDRTGDCECATIKNYPRDTRARHDRQQSAMSEPGGEGLVPLNPPASLIP